jgi:hypothetical protein
MTETRAPQAGGAYAQRLGQELRYLRGPKNLRDFARDLHMTSPGPFSQYENGRRLVPVPLLLQYAELPGANKKLLLELRRAAESEFVRANDQGPASSHATQAPTPAEVAGNTLTRPQRRAHHRILTATGLLLAAVIVAIGATLQPDPPAQAPVLPASARVLLSQPGNVDAVPRRTQLEGSIDGLPNDVEMWFATQAIMQDTYNVSEAPCVVSPTRFQCGEIYVGQPGDADAKKQFKVLFIVVKDGGPAEQEFRRYAARDKSRPDAYVGLRSLPDGASIIATVVLRRS